MQFTLQSGMQGRSNTHRTKLMFDGQKNRSIMPTLKFVLKFHYEILIFIQNMISNDPMIKK